MFATVLLRNVIGELSYESLLIILILSAPPVICASIIGLFVAVFQAATQIQEQTLAFAIKLVAVVVTMMFMGNWMGKVIYGFGFKIFGSFYKWK